MYEKARVALLAEGVDRNKAAVTAYDRTVVALIAEGVDRNPRKSVRALAA